MALAYKFNNKSFKEQYTASSVINEYMQSANVIKDIIYNLYLKCEMPKIGCNTLVAV